MKKKISYIVIIIIFIGILVSGFYYFKIIKPRNDQRDIEQAEIVKSFSEVFDKNDMVTSTTIANQIIEANPDKVRGYITLASVYLQQGLLLSQQEFYANLAYDVVQKILELDPENSDGYRMLALIHEIRMEFDDAFTAYNKAHELSPKDDTILTARGHLYFVMGENEPAKKDYDLALSINPKNSQALTNLALYYMRNNITDERDIEELLTSAIENEKNYAFLAEAYNAQGVFYLVNRWYEDAVVSYESALIYSPDMVPALNGLANAHLGLLKKDFDDKKFDELKDRLQTVVSLTEKINKTDPNFSRGYITKGLVLNKLQAYDAEKSAYKAGLAVVDKDMTLGMLEKEDVRSTFNELISKF